MVNGLLWFVTVCYGLLWFAMVYFFLCRERCDDVLSVRLRIYIYLKYYLMRLMVINGQWFDTANLLLSTNNQSLVYHLSFESFYIHI